MKNIPELSEKYIEILIPVYNDWESVEKLLNALDSIVFKRSINRVNILLVDDASTIVPPQLFHLSGAGRVKQINLLRLHRNLGHQRAIAVGLVHLYEHGESDTVIVMDGDGEDNPSDIDKLLEAVFDNEFKTIVFAERTIRSEGVVFYLFYQAYRSAHRLFTGLRIKFGNFSAIPRSLLKSLVTASELWSHYAAAVVSLKIPYTSVPTARTKRYSGQSKMNFVGLVAHGLGAIAVHREIVSIRILMAISLLGSIAIFILMGFVLLVAFQSTGGTVSILAIGIIFALLAQMFSIVLSLVFQVLGNRESMMFIPIRDCRFFIDKVESLIIDRERHGQ